MNDACSDSIHLDLEDYAKPTETKREYIESSRRPTFPIMDAHATTVVNCMLLALKTYPFKIYINDSNGVSAFNPIAELNLTSGPTVLAEYSVHGNAPTSASAR